MHIKVDPFTLCQILFLYIDFFLESIDENFVCCLLHKYFVKHENEYSATPFMTMEEWKGLPITRIATNETP